MAGFLIAYYRVSTSKQGASGLGLEAQEATVHAYAKSVGKTIKASYVEVESGKKSDRPELLKALGHARMCRGELCISKLDRLSRSVAFLAHLMEGAVPFVACDNPHATPLTLHILAAMAEHERAMISLRTKDAFKAYKARGGVLGTPANLTHEARLKGVKAASVARSEKADEAYGFLVPTLLEWRGAGLSQSQIAERLNTEGHTTRSGKNWTQGQVSRVLARVS